MTKTWSSSRARFQEIIKTSWTCSEGRVIPSAEDWPIFKNNFWAFQRTSSISMPQTKKICSSQRGPASISRVSPNRYYTSLMIFTKTIPFMPLTPTPGNPLPQTRSALPRTKSTKKLKIGEPTTARKTSRRPTGSTTWTSSWATGMRRRSQSFPRNRQGWKKNAKKFPSFCLKRSPSRVRIRSRCRRK